MHVGLADLIQLDDGSELQRQWTDRLVAHWAGQRAAAMAGGGDGAAWLTGPAAKGIVCDAVLFPLVTADPDLTVLDDLLKIAAELNRYLHPHDTGQQDVQSGPVDQTGQDTLAEGGAATDALVTGGAAAGNLAGQQVPTWPALDRDTDMARVRELMAEFVGGCVKLLSGEPGLAAYLRRNLLAGTVLDGKSLPLDVGDTDDVPWWIRRAVMTRDQRCTWPGGCDQPAAATQPHHVVHRFEHGATAAGNLSLLCFFHHHVVVHRWGWNFKINGDGSTQATSPDGRVYRSNSRPPPTRPG